MVLLTVMCRIIEIKTLPIQSGTLICLDILGALAFATRLFTVTTLLTSTLFESYEWHSQASPLRLRAI